MIQQNEDKILEILRSQGMVAKSPIEIDETGDQDQDPALEKAYQEFCENLYQIGGTEDMILPKEKVLEILKSREVVTSSIIGDEGQLLEAGYSLLRY